MIDTLPAPLLDELTAALGAAHVRVALRERRAYAYDATAEKHTPAAVVFPGSAAQVAAVVRAAGRHGVPVVPRGAGTNVSGGTTPHLGGIVLNLTRLNRIEAIDAAGRRARVQAGVTNAALNAAAVPHGFFFAPDPSSYRVATLGGNLAENSGGLHCLKYGVTTHHVLSLQVVLADGSIAELGGEAEDAPGYDLAGILVGCEGTLGVITAATVRLVPLPEGTRTLLATFADLEACVATVSAIIAARIVPAALELVDRASIAVVNASLGQVYPEAEAALVIEVDGRAAELDPQAEAIAALCRAGGATTVRRAHDAAEAAALWAGRRAMFGCLARMSAYVWAQDVTVPRGRLVPMLRRVMAIGREYGLSICTVAHAGDGNLHPCIPFDPREPGARERVHQADLAILRACVELGGSITGEHGVGIDKLPGMPLMFSPTQLGLMFDLRDALDPRRLLNPGKAVPLRTAGF